jgi:hypothetical protein
MWVVGLPEFVLDYHRLRVPIDHPDGSVTVAKLDLLDFIPFKPLTSNPILATGRLWFRSDLGRLLFTPDGTTSRYVLDLTDIATTGGLLAIWGVYSPGINYDLIMVEPIWLTVHSVIDFTNINPTGVADFYWLLATGWIIPRYSETYTFYLTSDDGCALSINGMSVIRDLMAHPPTTFSGTISLVADRYYPVLIGHYEYYGGQRLLFEWSSARQQRERVPSDRMAYWFLGRSYGSIEPVSVTGSVRSPAPYDWLLHELKMKQIPCSVEALGIPEAMKCVEARYGWSELVEVVRRVRRRLRNVKISVWSALEGDFESKWVRFEVQEGRDTHNTFIDIGVRRDCFEVSGDIVVESPLSRRVGDIYLELQNEVEVGDEVSGFGKELHYVAKMYYSRSERVDNIVDNVIQFLKMVGKVS